MKDQVDYKILKKFAGGKYSLNDFRLVSRWFDDINSEVELKYAIQKHWDEFSTADTGSEKNLSLVLNNLKEQIEFGKPAVSFRIKFQQFYFRAAAILLLPLVLYSLYSTFNVFPASEQTSSIEIFSPQGARTHFLLPDGTQGWLNSGSSLRYASNFDKKRNVSLTGEAWFEVVHNEKKPFVVRTPNLDVRVLGTKFNVAAFPEENITEVVLQEGKVKVDGNEKAFTAEMEPNEKFTYDKKKMEGFIQTVNSVQFSAWKDGLLVFRNEPLADVLKRIGRWYNVNILLTDPDLAKFKYRATFKDEPLEEVIRLISLTAPIEYSFDTRKPDENDTFKKRSIIIRRKKIDHQF
jgi:ferric-dicitrate binding protein FerR (iron transport regulator)